MRPVLALELSTDGILLHELSYDGVWRKVASAALGDPFLPKRMVDMRATARASQGRFFKNQIWMPPEQLHEIEVKLTSETPEARQREATEIMDREPGFTGRSLVIQVGEEDVNGYSKIAAIDRQIMLEAQRFANGYGFGCDGFTTAARIAGFYKQPYFDLTAPAKISIDFRKIGFFAMLGAGVAAIISGGMWAFNTIDFSTDPSTAIEAAEVRIIAAEEDPRAPIRPTPIKTVNSQRTSAALPSGQNSETLPALDISVASFTTQISQSMLRSSVSIAEAPLPVSAINPVMAPVNLPKLTTATSADNLPAPETNGFMVMETQLQAAPSPAGPSGFSGGTRLSGYEFRIPKNTLDITPRLTDVLPSDTSTVVLSAQLRKLNDSLGLTQVRENNAVVVHLAAAQELQQLRADVIFGRPDVLPLLRDGVEISDVPTTLLAPLDPNDEPEVLFTTIVSGLSIAQLQRIPPRVITNRPAILPVLRGGVEIGAIPVVEPEPEIIEPFDSIAETARIAVLQNLPANVITGRPAIMPLLRPEAEFPEVMPAPEAEANLTDAARLHPLSRPQTIEQIAVVNDPAISQFTIRTTNTPLHRNAGFAAKAEAMTEAAIEAARTTPTFTDAPREVNVPTSANVAREATIEDGIILSTTSLIGVYGKPGAYKALLRDRSGKYHMLTIGEKINGWTIVAIDESTVRIKKGSRTEVLRMPAEG